MNIAIGIPSSDTVNPQFAIDNFPQILLYTRLNLPKGSKVMWKYQTGVRTDRNRNIILDKFLKHEETTGEVIDYIMWLDADMIYPQDIILKYLEHKPFDIMGCLYFKRAHPYDPVGYIHGSSPGKYKAVDARKLKPGVNKVDGLGFGGMMVNMGVYRALGDKKWMKYGDDFHLPGAGSLTHDLVFCKTVQEAGYEILINSDIKPGHIGDRVATEDDWMKARQEKLTDRASIDEIDKRPKVMVIMPSTDIPAAQKLAKLMKSRAGYPCDIVIVDNSHPDDRMGFIETINTKYIEFRDTHDYFVYVAQDAFPGRNWLAYAVVSMVDGDGGVLAFNDGKWNGDLAAFGMFTKDFVSRHGYAHPKYNPIDRHITVPFCPEYKNHYADTELTVIAQNVKKLIYNPESVLVEVDFDKEGRFMDRDDRKTFKRRRDNGFDGRVTNEALLDYFESDKRALESISMPPLEEKAFDERVIPGETEQSNVNRHLARYDFAKQFINKEDMVLDAGCGVGYGSSMLREVSKEVLGFDIDKKSIEYAQINYEQPRLSFIQADISEITLIESYDVIVCFEVLEHLDDWRLFVDKVKGALKPGGRFIYSVPLNEPKGWNPHHKHTFNTQEAMTMIGWTVPRLYTQIGEEISRGVHEMHHSKRPAIVGVATKKS